MAVQAGRNSSEMPAARNQEVQVRSPLAKRMPEATAWTRGAVLLSSQEPSSTKKEPSSTKKVEDRLHLLALVHHGEGEGVALAAVVDVGGGVGVEVAGAALGLAAVDLGLVAHGLAVVGDQGQVHGHALGPAAQVAGHVVAEAAVEASEQLVAHGDPGEPGLADGLARGGRGEGEGGAGEGAEARAGGEEDVEHDAGGAEGDICWRG